MCSWGLAALILILAPSARAAAGSWSFVKRSGSQLTLDGKPFRFSGANVEWMGLIGYGPLNFEPGQTERFPSHYEINDALATAREMGATVIRAQTLGDTVGCGNCLEPSLGQFNPQAFQVMDYAIARAKAYGIRLILEFQGDARAENVSSSADIFSNWRGGASFWHDPTVIGDFENLIANVVDHVNSITGLPYRDDPTILGWMDCNECSKFAGSDTDSWVQTIAAYVKSLDPNHLFIDNAPALLPDPSVLADPDIDAYAAEVYPHWFQEASGDPVSGQAPQPHEAAAATAAADKVWMMSEFGWDKTNWQTPAALQSFLSGIQSDPNITGDLFWALEGHANGHGWEPLPADEQCQADVYDTAPPTEPSPSGAGCYTNEDGNWWALYYTGITTLSNAQADMATRAQLLRTHAYAMSGFGTPPPHQLPPAPIITMVSGTTVVFEGSAGAPDYSVQKYVNHRWKVRCSRCTTDAQGMWTDPTGRRGCYRMIAYNLDGLAGPPSATAGSGCPRRRHPHRRHHAAVG
jgi:mannan endo-1,4-beta-mannosidase